MRRLAVVALVVAMALGSGAPPCAATTDPVWIITEGEASLPSPPAARGGPALPQDGPVIKIERPELGASAALSLPFSIDVVFEPRSGGAPVKMESLKIVYVKVVELDVTERFKPYIKGNRLFVENANVPAGRHRLRITITDQNGNTTAEMLQVAVK